MFIKKDTRKLRDIIFDTNDRKEELNLNRRQNEFNGSLKELCTRNNVIQLANLRRLTLYDNTLDSVDGIGLLGSRRTQLEYLNLGHNQLKSIPDEINSIDTLRKFWAEDNHFHSFPIVLTLLLNLEELRLSGNRISDFPEAIGDLLFLTVLTLDNNEISEVPKSIGNLSSLTSLNLRQNRIVELPDEIGLLKSLHTLCISSNLIEKLPRSMMYLTSLQYLYANSNKIAYVEPELTDLPLLRKINLAKNLISSLPLAWKTAWGDVNTITGKMNGLATSVILLGNPIIDVGHEKSVNSRFCSLSIEE